MDKDMELEFLKEFAREERGWGTSAQQIRALWTAVCLHHDIHVGTKEYDELIANLWRHVDEDTPMWSGFNEFCNFMCEFMCEEGGNATEDFLPW